MGKRIGNVYYTDKEWNEMQRDAMPDESELKEVSGEWGTV